VCTDNLDKTLLFCKHGFAYIKGEEADLNGVAIFHSDHPLALGVVESVQGTRVAIDMATTTGVLSAVAVVPLSGNMQV
jgi:hypothetical protein